MTHEELYEQVKRSLRRAAEDGGYDPAGSGFILACHDCGQPFPTDAEVGMVSQHAELAHEGDGDKAKLDLIWIGEGPPPEPNRAARRAHR